jgi:hypothetical protein
MLAQLATTMVGQTHWWFRMDGQQSCCKELKRKDSDEKKMYSFNLT